MGIQYLTEHQVIFLNSHQINLFSPNEHLGVKDAGLLSSAAHLPMQTWNGEDGYPTIHDKAAALFESLAKNHAFHNANKRTAFASLYMFLRQNGYRLQANPKEAENFTVHVVKSKPPIPLIEISGWIKEHSFKE